MYTHKFDVSAYNKTSTFLHGFVIVANE